MSRAPETEEEIDDYSSLDDDQLLALALKDDDEDVKEKKKKKSSQKPKKSKPMNKSNILYLGHIPHGFYEHEIEGFLSQFGKVRKVRVSRSKKTGKSRGYAFIQLYKEDVAKIVQKTLHGYILMGRALVCMFVPEEHVHEKMFQGGLTPHSKTLPSLVDQRKKRVLDHLKTPSSRLAESRRLHRLAKADKLRKQKLLKKGFHFEFEGYGK